jgi:hypothetical protein
MEIFINRSSLELNAYPKYANDNNAIFLRNLVESKYDYSEKIRENNDW